MSRLCSEGSRAAKASNRDERNHPWFRKLTWPGEETCQRVTATGQGREKGCLSLMSEEAEMKRKQKVWKLSADEVTGDIYIFLMLFIFIFHCKYS